MHEAPLQPACALTFDRVVTPPSDRMRTRTPHGSPPDEVVLSQPEKNKIRSRNIIEQAEFKAAAKAKLTEVSRSGDSEQNKALMLVNDTLRLELARLSEALRKNRNKIRKLKAALAGKSSAKEI